MPADFDEQSSVARVQAHTVHIFSKYLAQYETQYEKQSNRKILEQMIILYSILKLRHFELLNQTISVNTHFTFSILIFLLSIYKIIFPSQNSVMLFSFFPEFLV